MVEFGAQMSDVGTRPPPWSQSTAGDSNKENLSRPKKGTKRPLIPSFLQLGGFLHGNIIYPLVICYIAIEHGH